MAARRRKHTRKLEARQRDSARSMAGLIAVRVLSDPVATRGVGMLLESLGKAMQRSADAKSTTEPTAPTSDVFDLSAFSKREKADG